MRGVRATSCVLSELNNLKKKCLSRSANTCISQLVLSPTLAKKKKKQAMPHVCVCVFEPFRVLLQVQNLDFTVDDGLV